MDNNEITYTLITGASEGLGKAMALECAERKRNIILVSLPCIELFHLASYIRHKYKVRVCEFELDLAKESNRFSLYRTVRANNLSIDMLINNAGIGGTGYFQSGNYEVWQRQIDLNITAVVHLTHLFLPDLKKHPKSYLLNISSLCVFFYPPQKQVYGATKSFIYFFSKSLRTELKKDGVTVTVLCPGAVNTSPVLFLLNHGDSWITRNACMDPQQVASIAINGLMKGKARIIPGRWSLAFYYLDKILPARLKKWLITNKMKNIRQDEAEKLLQGNTRLPQVASIN
jgi:uncharacterized protein